MIPAITATIKRPLASSSPPFDSLNTIIVSLHHTIPKTLSLVLRVSKALQSEIKRGFYLPFTVFAMSEVARIKVLVERVERDGRGELKRWSEIIPSSRIDEADITLSQTGREEFLRWCNEERKKIEFVAVPVGVFVEKGGDIGEVVGERTGHVIGEDIGEEVIDVGAPEHGSNVPLEAARATKGLIENEDDIGDAIGDEIPAQSSIFTSASKKRKPKKVRKETRTTNTPKQPTKVKRKGRKKPSACNEIDDIFGF